MNLNEAKQFLNKNGYNIIKENIDTKGLDRYTMAYFGDYFSKITKKLIDIIVKKCLDYGLEDEYDDDGNNAFYSAVKECESIYTVHGILYEMSYNSGTNPSDIALELYYSHKKEIISIIEQYAN